MGLYDGRVGCRGFSSTAHVAALTRTPVVLVVDISRSSRSIGAVVHGMATWDPSVDVAGVILNQAGSPRHAAEVRESISPAGARRRPSRPRPGHAVAPPRPGPRRRTQRGRRTSSTASPSGSPRPSTSTPSSHWPAPPPISRRGGPWTAESALLGTEITPSRLTSTRADSAISAPAPVVAVAGGRAFTFRYAETAELLRSGRVPGGHVRPRDRPRAAGRHDRALPRRRLPRGARRGAQPATPRCVRRSATPSATACRPSPSAPGCSTSAAPSTAPRWPGSSTPTRR